MPVTRTRTVVLIGASFYLAVRSFAGGSSAGADALREVR